MSVGVRCPGAPGVVRAPQALRACAGVLAAVVLAMLILYAGSDAADATQPPAPAGAPLQAATLSADGIAPTPVVLPLRWPNRPGGPSRLHVAIDFEHPAPDALDEALYLNFLLDGGTLTLNGRHLASIGESDAQRFVRWKRSRLIGLPPGALVAGVNRLELDLPVPAAGTTVHVPRPVIGPRDQLERRAWWRDFWFTLVPVVTVVGSLFVAFGALSIWFLRRSEVLFGLFGLVTLMWGLRSITFVAESIPSQWWPLWRFFFQSVSAGAAVALALFALRFAGLVRPALERVLIAACAAGPLVTLLSGAALDAAVTRWWTPVLVATLAVAVAAMVRAVRVQRSWPAWSVLVAMALCLLMGVHDYLIYSTDWLDRVWPAWAEQRFLLLHYATNLMMLMIALTLVQRFVTTLRDFEQLSATLEQRVGERERQLAANYTRLGELQREHAAFEERDRIMQDLHDGLGAQLFSSLSRVERGAIDAGGVAQVLRECIAELRLALDAQAFGEHELGSALGPFMQRWNAALRGAGIEPAWRIDLPEDALHLPPGQALEVLRVLQEALTNVLRHAGARHASVLLALEDEQLLVAIEDDGRGMPAAPAAGGNGGRGLSGMQRRARRLGARLGIETEPGRTRIVLRMARPSRIHGMAAG